MKRRGFLGALLGLAAAPVLARLPLMTAAEGIEVVETPIILPTLRGVGEVLEVTLMGLGCMSNGSEHVRLMRGGTTALSMSTHRMGGLSFWSMHAQPLIFSERQPLVLDLSPLASARVIFRRGGRLYAIFADHSRVESDVPLFRELASAS